jgi:hypothetical protein
MEYLHGRTLARMLAEEGILPLKQVTYQMCTGQAPFNASSPRPCFGSTPARSHLLPGS